MREWQGMPPLHFRQTTMLSISLNNNKHHAPCTSHCTRACFYSTYIFLKGGHCSLHSLSLSTEGFKRSERTKRETVNQQPQLQPHHLSTRFQCVWGMGSCGERARPSLLLPAPLSGRRHAPHPTRARVQEGPAQCRPRALGGLEEGDDAAHGRVGGRPGGQDFQADQQLHHIRVAGAPRRGEGPHVRATGCGQGAGGHHDGDGALGAHTVGRAGVGRKAGRVGVEDGAQGGAGTLKSGVGVVWREEGCVCV